MNTVTYQEYKDAFYAFAGKLSKQEYLNALEDADFLDKFIAHLYGKSAPAKDSDEWIEFDRINTEYCENLYTEIEGIL